MPGSETVLYARVASNVSRSLNRVEENVNFK